MPNIDELSIQFSSKGTSTAVQNIKDMGYAVRGLAASLKAIDSSKLGAFTSAMSELKKSTPTATQTNRMVAFSDAIKGLSSAIGTANISSFSKDMATLGGAVETFKRSSVNSIQNAVTAMQNFGTATQQTASIISNVIPKKSQAISFTDSKGSVSASKEIVASLNKVEVKAKGVTSILQKMGIITPTKQFKTLEESAEKVRQKYEQLRSTIQKGLNEGSITSGDSTYKKKMAELDALRNKYDELILKQRELAQAGDSFKINPTWEKSISVFKSGFSSVTGIVKGGLLAAMKGVNNHVKSFTSRIREAGSALKKTVSGGNNATKMAKKFANELLRVSKMLKLMITRMALRKVIAEVGNGFKSLAIHSDEFNNSVSGMMNGAKKLGYSFAALVSPLINALAPAIVYVINLLTKLANVIQQVFGALTGATTWNKAKDFTDSWRDSIEGAGKAAKDLKKTVLGFDELNQLQENKDSSGGGSGITDMFETMKIDPKWKEFADWLKDMWKMGDFTELGKKLGEGLRSILESIPWDKIRATSHKLGESLATLINGFVEVERLGYDIGYTIAQSVNTVFEFLNGFVHKLHWDSIGKFIGETFNGFFENIDWALIKDTVVTGMAGIAEAIQNFIDTFHWDNISNFIINAIDTIASGIKAFVEGIDWLDLGKKMGDQLAKAIRGTNWLEVGEAIGDVIQAGISWVSGVLETLPSVEELVKAAGNVITGLFNKVDMYELGANIGKILAYIYNALTEFWNTYGDTIKDEVGKFFKGIWDNIDKTELAKILAKILGVAVLAGIAAMGWAAIKQYFASKLLASVLGSTLTSSLAGGVTEAAAGAEVAEAAGAAGITIGGLIVNGIAAGMGAVIGLAIAEPIKRGLFNLGELIANATGNDEAVEKIRNMHEAYNQMGGSLNLLKDGFKEFYELLGGEVDRSIYQLTDDVGNTTKVVDDLGNTIIEFTNAADGLNKQSKEVADNAKNISTAYKGPTEAVEKYKKQTEESSKVVGNFAETHRKANEDWNRIHDSISKTTTTATENKKALDDLSASTKTTTTDIQALANSISKEFGVADADFTKALNDMANETSTSFQSISDDSKKVTVDLPEDMQKAIDDIMKSQTDLSTNTDTSVKDIMKYVDDGTKGINDDLDTIKKAMTKEQWTFNGVAEGLKQTFKKAREGIASEWNQIANKLNGEHQVASGKMKIDLPKFARGGFPEDGLFLASHHELVGQFSNGKTAVANNGQIIEGISAGVYNAFAKAASSNNGGSKYISNEIIVDGEVIARTVTKAQEKQNRRYSPAY